MDCHFTFCPVFNTGLNFKFPSVRKFLFTIYYSLFTIYCSPFTKKLTIFTEFAKKFNK